MMLLKFLLVIFSALTIVALPFRSLDDLSSEDTEEIIANNIDEYEPTNIIDLSFYGENIYGQPDIDKTGQLIANYSTETSISNPEELGSYLEGDILVPAPANFESGRALTRNGITTQSSRWPKGIVPFEVRGNFGNRDMATIESAIEQYHKRTCIRFVPRTNEKDYVSIVSSSSGCWSSVGRIGGKQEVNLQSPGCLTKPGTAIHELMHAIGFLHEQNRHERDNFVTIQYHNIQPSATSNFERVKTTNAFGVPYDYGSVMHYSANAFSINGKPTIVATQPGGNEKMGQRDGFSEYDVAKINQMYNCPVAGETAARPKPIAANGNNNNVVNSFLGGLISGLGLQDD